MIQARARSCTLPLGTGSRRRRRPSHRLSFLWGGRPHTLTVFKTGTSLDGLSFEVEKERLETRQHSG